MTSKRSIERRLSELEPTSGLAAETYLVRGPGLNGFVTMSRAEYIRYCDRTRDRIDEVSAEPLSEGELAAVMMDTLKAAYKEES